MTQVRFELAPSAFEPAALAGSNSQAQRSKPHQKPLHYIDCVRTSTAPRGICFSTACDRKPTSGPSISGGGVHAKVKSRPVGIWQVRTWQAHTHYVLGCAVPAAPAQEKKAGRPSSTAAVRPPYKAVGYGKKNRGKKPQPHQSAR